MTSVYHLDQLKSIFIEISKVILIIPLINCVNLEIQKNNFQIFILENPLFNYKDIQNSNYIRITKL